MTHSQTEKRIRSTKRLDEIVSQIDKAPDSFTRSHLILGLQVDLMKGRMMRYLKKRYARP